MCRRTGLLTLHLNEFFFSINGISRSCCWKKPGNKTTRWNFAPRQKFTLTHQMEHRRVLSSRTCGFSFTSAKPTRWKYLKMLITFSTAHLFFDMLQYCYYKGELQSVGILGSGVVLSFTLSLTGEMRVTLL